jgi:starch synthase
MRVAFISSEVAPLSKTGGLGDVAISLPKALKHLGIDVEIYTPYYSVINRRGIKIKRKKGIRVYFSGEYRTVIFFLAEFDGIKAYLVRYDAYFRRDYLYTTPDGDYKDNAERFALFSKAIMQYMFAEQRKQPHIIHTNDWQTALVQLYKDEIYEKVLDLSTVRTVHTLHNLGYQGVFPREKIKYINQVYPDYFPWHLEFYGNINYTKSAVYLANAVTTVSKKYAEEIQSSKYGYGLDGVLRDIKHKLYGILNGVDYGVWDPRNDQHIRKRYYIESLDRKQECKEELLYIANFKDRNVPIIGIISRLAEQKGFDIIEQVIPMIIKEEQVYFIVLGTGDLQYEKSLMELAKRYSSNVKVFIEFNDPLAHKIEAGADMFLMPSKYEPCGLNQMYSLRYGTIPIVRATGGLDDTIIDYDENKEKGNGFKFSDYSSDALLLTIKRAIRVYERKEDWNKIMIRAMKEDFSWERSAEKYMKLYEKILKGG